jgi:hypothetical protein
MWFQPYVNRSLMSFREAVMVVAGRYRRSTHIRDIIVDVKAKLGNQGDKIGAVGVRTLWYASRNDFGQQELSRK